MLAQAEPHIPLPKDWKKHVRSSLLHVISLARFAAAYIHAWGADSINPRLRKTSERPRLTATIVLQSNRSGSDRKPCSKNRPSTATNRATGPDISCNFRQSDCAQC